MKDHAFELAIQYCMKLCRVVEGSLGEGRAAWCCGRVSGNA